MKVKLFKDGTYSLIVNVGGKGLTLLIGVLLFRILGSSQYGVYSYILSLVLTLTIPVEFGLPNLIVRETAKALALNRPSKVKGMWIWSAKVSLIISIVVIFGALIVGLLAGNLVEEFDIRTLFWGVGLILVWPLVHLSGAALRGLNKVVMGQIPGLILINGFYALILVIFAFFVPSELTTSNAMALRLIATAFAAFIGIGLLYSKAPHAVKSEPPEYHSRYWLSSAFPLGMTSGLNTIKNRAGILLLGFFVASDQIGVYQVAVNAAVFAGLVLHVINTILAPQFASLYAEGKMKRLQKLVTMSARAAFMFNLAVTLLFILFGKYLLVLVFGSDAAGAYHPMLIMLVGQMVNSLAGSVGLLLNMTGHEKDVMKAIGFSVVINIISNLIFIPLWGIMGSAVATALSLIIAQVLMWYRVRKNLSINTMAFGKNISES